MIPQRVADRLMFYLHSILVSHQGRVAVFSAFCISLQQQSNRAVAGNALLPPMGNPPSNFCVPLNSQPSIYVLAHHLPKRILCILNGEGQCSLQFTTG